MALSSSSRNIPGVGFDETQRPSRRAELALGGEQETQAGRVAERHVGQLDFDVAEPCLERAIQRLAQHAERCEIELAPGLDLNVAARLAGPDQDPQAFQR